MDPSLIELIQRVVDLERKVKALEDRHPKLPDVDQQTEDNLRRYLAEHKDKVFEDLQKALE